MTATTTPVAAGTDIGETIDDKFYNRVFLKDTAGADAMGLVVTAPAANTLLGRLKAIADALAGMALDATIAALSAKLPVSLGAKAQSGSLSIVPATGTDLATDTTVKTTASADDLFAITPSDSTPLATIPKALLVTAAGNVAVRGTGASPVTIPVTVGQVLPIRARYVYATNTTATVVGLV